jgi:hypothetical protein
MHSKNNCSMSTNYCNAKYVWQGVHRHHGNNARADIQLERSRLDRVIRAE